jgi:hypothetical protein
MSSILKYDRKCVGFLDLGFLFSIEPYLGYIKGLY